MKGLHLNLMCACVVVVAVFIAYHVGATCKEGFMEHAAADLESSASARRTLRRLLEGDADVMRARQDCPQATNKQNCALVTDQCVWEGGEKGQSGKCIATVDSRKAIRDYIFHGLENSSAFPCFLRRESAHGEGSIAGGESAVDQKYFSTKFQEALNKCGDKSGGRKGESKGVEIMQCAVGQLDPLTNTYCKQIGNSDKYCCKQYAKKGHTNLPGGKCKCEEEALETEIRKGGTEGATPQRDDCIRDALRKDRMCSERAEKILGRHPVDTG
jgi:hypothetical protein